MYGIFHSRFELLFVTLIIILVYSLNRICIPFIVKKLEGGGKTMQFSPPLGTKCDVLGDNVSD